MSVWVHYHKVDFYDTIINRMAKKKSTKKQYSLKRAPIVTMLGHVDHGKTSILDSIRGTKVQSCEAGGITQSVRAHRIEHTAKDGEVYPITFVDTPGHEAFSEMRSRGASITDLVVLVVAADDSVQPQTKEAISYIQKAKIPVIVALNKTDIEGVDKAKVKRELSQEGIQVEDLGGEVMCIETSAKTGNGIDDLLEAILLVAELSELKKKRVKQGIGEAVVLESTRDSSLGAISLCLLKAGEVHIGDYVSWNGCCGKIRAIKNEDFCDEESATLSAPIWLAGFDEEVPVGVTLYFFKNLDAAKEATKVKPSEDKSETEKEETDSESGEEDELDTEILSQLLSAQEDDDKPVLNLILRSESQGTLEVVLQELEGLESDEVGVNILDASTGEINEDDIIKAKTAGGIVIGFKTKLSKKNAKIAKQEKVLVKNYEIIYELLEEVAEVVESLMKPVEEEMEVARAEVKKVFELSDGSFVAGCKVTKGSVVKGYRCFVERVEGKEKKRIGEGKITSLKHNKDEVREAPKGTECGIFIEPQIEIEKGDDIVCFKIEKV